MDIGDFFQKEDADELAAELYDGVLQCAKEVDRMCRLVDYEIVMEVLRSRIDCILLAENIVHASVFTCWWWRLRLRYENYRLSRSIDFCRMFLGIKVK